MFRGTPADIIGEVFKMMEKLVPVILTPQQATYWRLYYFEQKSQREIGKLCGRTSGASVCKTLARSRETMWSVLEILFPKLSEHPWQDFLIPYGVHHSAQRYQNNYAKSVYPK